jgi:hypothetical protein
VTGPNAGDGLGRTLGSVDPSGLNEPTNAAGRDVFIGAQVATVHGDFVYHLPPDAPPAQKYEIGVNYLEGGVPSKARTLINEAFMSGYTGNEVQFHRLLALLSGRTLRQLSPEDRLELRSAQNLEALEPVDAWAAGIEAINLILAASEGFEHSAADGPDKTLKRLDEIGKNADTQEQWAKILRHLDLLHRGSLRNQIWARAAAQAEEDRFKGQRQQRAWKFFQPEPAGPRVSLAAPVQIPIRDRAWAAVTTGLLIFCLLRIGELLASGGRTPTALLLPVIALAMYMALRYGACWLALIQRKRVLDRRYLAEGRHQSPPPVGFARDVDHRFAHYFSRYVPRDTDREEWLRQTEGIRRTLRDEIVETYRESRVSAAQVAWIIRYRVAEVKRQWEAGRLLAHQQELRMPLSVQTVVISSVIVAAVAVLQIVQAAIRIDPLPALGWSIAAGVVTYSGARVWLRILAEHRRREYDLAESERRLAESTAAYERWKEKLRDSPTDSEMAAWLDADRQTLLQRILNHYRLTAMDLVTQAFIEAPGDSARHARVVNGPWRYTRYQMLAFLLTSDGVRQFRADLDFITGDLHSRSRSNYRYDNVGSVHVLVEGDRRTFELSLNDSQRLELPVLIGREELQGQEKAGAVNQVTLEATGIDHTLHVLEGIAAEGKNWIVLEEQRSERQLSGPLAIPGETVAHIGTEEGDREIASRPE